MAMQFKKYCRIALILILASFSNLYAQEGDFDWTDVTCFNANDGTISITLTEGGSTYIYVRTNLENSKDSVGYGPTSEISHVFTSVKPGKWVTYVRDIATDESFASIITIKQPAPLVSSFTDTKINCYGSATGEITFTPATGGSGSFDYTVDGTNWVNGKTSFTGLTSKNYYIAVRDHTNPGCVLVLNASYFLNQNPQLSATVTVNNPLCNGQPGTITISNPTGGSAGGTYQYKVGTAAWTAASTFNLAPGSYTIQMRKSGATSCVVSLGTYTITQPPVLAVNISIDKGLTCFDGSDARLKANVSGGTPPYSYEWYYVSGSDLISIGQTTQIATGLSQRRYQVSVTDANGCVAIPANIQFIYGALGAQNDSIPQQFFYDGATTITACEGESNGSITLNSHGGVTPYKYSITTGGNSGYQVSNQFTGVAAGNYQPWVMDKRGCKKTGPDVVVGSTPKDPVSVTITPSVAGSFCPGTSVTFTANPVNGGTNPVYQWKLNGNPVGNNQPTYTNNSLQNGDKVTVTLTSDIRCTSGNPATSAPYTAAVLVPVSITGQPVSQTLCAGSNVTFTVTATGSSLSYQWLKNGANVGGNSPTLTINNITTADAGTYTVKVSNSCGTVTSGAATLTVNTVPAISAQPASLTVCEGATASFSVTATGGALSYEWRRNGSAVGTNSPTLTLNNVTPAMAGNYTVYITNPCGNVTSAIAVLTVNTAPVITDQPDNVTICSGNNVTLSVTATGGDLTYQWKRNGVNVGTSSPTYTINGATPAQAGIYTVYISNSCGNVTSATATLTVNTVPLITDQPDNTTVCSGGTATFNVTATGGDLTYQWKRNGVNVGTNSPTLTLNGVTPAMAGNYTVYISNSCGNVTSEIAVLKVNTAPAISDQPDDVKICSGQNATFTVTASGGDLTYEWRRNGVAVGTNSPTLSLTNVTPAMAGNYTVYISNSCGNITSATAVLTVNTIPVVTDQPDNVTVCSGDNVTFTVTATGGDLTYQWRRDGVPVGTNSPTLTLTGVTPAMAGNYTVFISNSCGNVTSSTAVLKVNTAPAITDQPDNVTACSGQNATFTVAATGGDLTYQWKRDGVNVGTNSPTLTLNNITPANAGNYTVYISNSCGNITSATAVLTVNTIPVITDQPDNVTVCSGDNTTFIVTASGGDLSYEWRRNGVAVGTNSPTLTLNGVTPAMAGNYTVYIWNSCGNVTSVTAVLTVNTVPAISDQPDNVTVCSGSTATFGVTASGGDLTYEWRRNGVAVGSNSPTLTLTNVTPAMAGNYTVYISNACGNVTSAIAVLTVNTAPAITTQPAGITACEGDNASFSVTATGGNLTYEWRRNGVAVGTDSPTLTLIGVTPAMAGNYTVYISNECGNITSTTAELRVNMVPVITDQPDNTTTCEGGTATFSVAATGGDLVYEWRHDGAAVGTNSPTLTLNNVTAAMAGNYTVYISNSCGNITSSIATLAVNHVPVITTQPESVVRCESDNVTFTVDADGMNLTYQWRKNGTNIPGATSNSLSVNNISAADAGNYTVVVTNECGNVISSVAELTVNISPAITLHPESITKCAGTDHELSVSATGQGLNYLWRKNGIPMVPAQTGSTLSLNNINSADAGSYDVVITNGCGSTTSSVAILTVAENPVIIDHPYDLEYCEGENITFSVNATGTGISYQWRKDGTDIPGATSADLNLNAISLSDAGEYDVVIAGFCGTLISDIAELTVNPATSGTIEDDKIACAGDNVSLTVTANGSGALFYQWQKYIANTWIDIWDDGKYSGTFSPSLEIMNVEIADSGLYRVLVSGDCGSVYTEPVRLDVSNLIATIGTPAPFLINTETTKIEVGFKIEDHYLIHDLGFALVAPDGTEVMLKSPLFDVCAGNYSNPVNVDATFTNMPESLPEMDYCTPLFNVTGIFGSEGDWSVLNGKDPANGAWQIRVYDNTRYWGNTDGILTSATLTFTDLDSEGNTRVISYNSGAISIDIMEPVALEMSSTSYIAPMKLMTSCFNTEDAKAVVTVVGGVPPYTYEWSGPTVEAGEPEADLGPGFYTVTVTDFNGCSTQASVEVTSPPAILWENVLSTDSIVCNGASEGEIRAKAIGGSGGFNYTLLPGDIPSSVADSGVFTGLTAGTYTLRATDINGCMLDTVIVISQNDPIVLNIQTVPVIGDVKGSIIITATGGVAPYRYSIDNGATLQSDGTFNDLDAGIYKVYVVDTAGCIAVADVNMNVELLDVDVNVHDVSCYGLADGSFYLALIDGNGPYTLTGSFTDTLTMAGGAFSFTGQVAGTYDVKIEDSDGRVFLDNIVISQPDAIVATGSVTNATCSAITNDGGVDITVSGGAGGFTFDWSNGSTSEDLENVEAGNYKVVITDDNGCSTEYSYNVVGLNMAIAYAGENDTICPGTEYQFFGSPVADSVRWEPANLLDDPTLINPVANIETTTRFIYTVYDNGCYDRDTVVIDVHERIGMDIYDPSASTAIRDSIYMLEGEIAVMAATPGFASYRWEPVEGLSNPAAEAVTASPASTTHYIVYGTTDKGCIETDMVKVVIARKIIIFTGFSPNGDEHNETWIIQNAYQYGERIRVRVFNRWGELVFESKGYSVEWDGTRNGRPLPVGAYYYIIDVKDGKSEPYTGTVTILR